MKKSEAMIDKIFNTILCIVLLGGFLGAMLIMVADSPQEVPPKGGKKNFPMAVKFNCVHCGWKNHSTLYEFPDTTTRKK